MHIPELLRYSDYSRRLLRATLEQREDVFDTPFETIAEFCTIRLLTAHIIGAEERWIMQRLRHATVGPRYETRAPLTVAGVFDDWERIRANTAAFVGSTGTSGLTGMVPVSLPQWGFEGKKTVEQILFHVFNHQTYHLGQISMALQQLRIDPPNFDYVFLSGDHD
jgi:uncharacterized damage-inducible protein DinB